MSINNNKKTTPKSGFLVVITGQNSQTAKRMSGDSHAAVIRMHTQMVYNAGPNIPDIKASAAPKRRKNGLFQLSEIIHNLQFNLCRYGFIEAVSAGVHEIPAGFDDLLA